ncbi:MAG: GNAT family protein [Gemmatimonadota bacterium]
MHLRELRASDEAEYLRVHERSRAEFGPWMPTASPEGLFERALATSSYEGRDGRTHVRFVGETPDERIAALFALGEIVRGYFRSAYASWAVSSEYTNQGYGTEGVLGLLDIAFSERRGLGLHRVQANIIPANGASLRVAEKAGFRREGLAERYLLIANGWQDHVMHAKTAEEHELRYL